MTSEVYSKRKKMNTSAENKALNFQNKNEKKLCPEESPGEEWETWIPVQAVSPQAGHFPFGWRIPKFEEECLGPEAVLTPPLFSLLMMPETLKSTSN